MPRVVRFDVAQICEFGHLINEDFEEYPDRSADYCPDCGSKSIVACPSCDEPIRGAIKNRNVFRSFTVPNFCRACGKSYPWLSSRLEAARALAREQGSLTEEERELFVCSIDDIVRDSPGTPVAADRFKKFLAKIGGPARQAIRDLLVDVISETAKKIMFPR